MTFFSRISSIFDRPLQLGTVLLYYRIESVIGMGSYGFTYRVTDLNTGEEKVLKQLRKSKQKLASGRKSFQNEQAILQEIKHSCIPQLFHSFVWNDEPFFVMTYIQGKTFEQLIFEEQHVYTEERAFSIIYDILRIVSHFHKQGIIHRDLRIPNILTEGGLIYIVDFGLACRMGEKDTREETFFGEKQYMREIHYRSDFYALGHFLLFLLYSGYTPVLKKERPWYEELPLSHDGRSIIMRMLRITTPYENAEELMNHIETMEKERSICFKDF
jgi:serine/threonine-protein kinase